MKYTKVWIINGIFVLASAGFINAQSIFFMEGNENKDEAGFRKVFENTPEIMSMLDKEDNVTARMELVRDLRVAYKKYFTKIPNDTVKFFLYDDPSYPSKFKEIIAGDEKSIQQIKIPKSSVLKILIHGFSGNQTHTFPQEVKNAFLKHTKHPVICVDWSPMAGDTDTPKFRHITEPFLYTGIVDSNIPIVGEYVGKFVVSLEHDNVISSLDQVHLIGHSLGAHVSGQVGKTVQKDTKGDKLGRITGLDPAGPHFQTKTVEQRLTKGDAQFVDIYHTSYFAGDRRPVGHVDFFPNSENIPQPGCEKTGKTGIAALSHIVDVLIGSCDHHRAVDFYTESISNKNHIGCKFSKENPPKSERSVRMCSEHCDKEVIYGEHLSHTAKGEYCLKLVLK